MITDGHPLLNKVYVHFILYFMVLQLVKGMEDDFAIFLL